MGIPDGLTVDSEGFLWSVQYNGRSLDMIQQGRSSERFSFQFLIVPVCAFGGEKLDELYITTDWNERSKQQRKQFFQSGVLFRLKTDIKAQYDVDSPGSENENLALMRKHHDDIITYLISQLRLRNLPHFQPRRRESSFVHS